jgi:hypothetical protein
VPEPPPPAAPDPEAHDAPTAPILGYADTFTANELRGRRLLFHFCLGLVAGGAAVMSLAIFLYAEHGRHVSLLTVPVFLASAALLSILPATFALGLTVWLRQRILRRVRYRGFVASFLVGGACGFLSVMWALHRVM